MFIAVVAAQEQQKWRRGAGIVVLPVTEKYFTNQEAHNQRVSLDLTFWKYVDREGKTISAHPDHRRFSGWDTIYRALLEEFGHDRYHFDHDMVGFDQLHDSVTLHLANGLVPELPNGWPGSRT